MTHIRKGRVEDSPGIAHVHVQGWLTTYQGIVPDEVLANLDTERREAFWRQTLTDHAETHPLYVAENEQGQITGFISGGQEREGSYGYSGELLAIYLLPEARGSGTGRKLVQILVKNLIQLGYDSMLVWVLAQNPACGFYEALGGQVITEKSVTMGGKALIEVAYGWENISQLIQD